MSSETVVKEMRTYKGHYITLKITVTPPLPAEDPCITAFVKVYDGKPPDKAILSITPEGDIVDSWDEEVDNYESEDELTELLQKAKERVDKRIGQKFGVTESARIAMERELDD